MTTIIIIVNIDFITIIAIITGSTNKQKDVNYNRRINPI